MGLTQLIAREAGTVGKSMLDNVSRAVDAPLGEQVARMSEDRLVRSSQALAALKKPARFLDEFQQFDLNKQMHWDVKGLKDQWRTHIDLLDEQSSEQIAILNKKKDFVAKEGGGEIVSAFLRVRDEARALLSRTYRDLNFNFQRTTDDVKAAFLDQPHAHPDQAFRTATETVYSAHRSASEAGQATFERCLKASKDAFSKAFELLS